MFTEVCNQIKQSRNITNKNKTNDAKQGKQEHITNYCLAYNFSLSRSKVMLSFFSIIISIDNLKLLDVQF